MSGETGRATAYELPEDECDHCSSTLLSDELGWQCNVCGKVTGWPKPFYEYEWQIGLTREQIVRFDGIYRSAHKWRGIAHKHANLISELMERIAELEDGYDLRADGPQ